MQSFHLLEASGRHQNTCRQNQRKVEKLPEEQISDAIKNATVAGFEDGLKEIKLM
jgi:hypothetical protein